MPHRLPLTTLLLLAACQTALPTAHPTPAGHGLQRVWVVTFGLE